MNGVTNTSQEGVGLTLEPRARATSAKGPYVPKKESMCSLKASERKGRVLKKKKHGLM